MTSTKKDTYDARFDEKTVKIKPGDAVTFTVWDKDVWDDDLIGRMVSIFRQADFDRGSIVITPVRERDSDWSNRIDRITVTLK